MGKSAESLGTQAPRAGIVAKPVYYVSDRPEAYEITGEVSHEEAAAIGQAIVEHAGRRFPGVEFRIDGDWHSHQPGMETVAAYIEEHWQRWVEQARS